ncbi:MAG: sigma 54-interacting transcriptional regulator [Nitrospiraceae bacterium]
MLAASILRQALGSIPILNWEYRRIPLGALKIGKIAQGFGSMYTNDVLGDDRLPNKQWMKDNGLYSFAGHPLMFRGELLGVAAIFGRRPLSKQEFARLAVFANKAAIAIRNVQLFTEVEQLKRRLQAENLYLREEVRREHNFEEIIGNSPILKAVLRKIEQVAPTDSTVLILGETGTGKELIARAIHNLSLRKAHPLVRGELWSNPRQFDGKRTLWPREGLLYRCHSQADRTLRVGRRWDDLSE